MNESWPNWEFGLLTFTITKNDSLVSEEKFVSPKTIVCCFFFFFFLEHPNYEQKRNSRLIVIRSKVQKYELLKIEIPVNNTLLFEDRKREKEGEREIDN